jgi:hypothetical protein
MSVRIEGFKFAALNARMRKNIAGELNSAVDSGVSLGKQLAPVLTGFLRDNIQPLELATPDKLRAAYESGADYSAFVNFGTIFMDANPYFSISFEDARRQLNNGLLRVLR